MTYNVGTIDRTLRIVLGLGLLSLVFVGTQTLWGACWPRAPADRTGQVLPGLQHRGHEHMFVAWSLMTAH